MLYGFFLFSFMRMFYMIIRHTYGAHRPPGPMLCSRSFQVLTSKLVPKMVLFLSRILGGSPLQRHCSLQRAPPQNASQKKIRFRNSVRAMLRGPVWDSFRLDVGVSFSVPVAPGFATGGLMMTAATWSKQGTCQMHAQSHSSSSSLHGLIL